MICSCKMPRHGSKLVVLTGGAAVVLCDRGTLDGLAYWPGDASAFVEELGTTHEAELGRYTAVIHLHTPEQGYNHANPVRTETMEQALAADARILAAWAGHPRRFTVDSSKDFLEKLARTIALIRDEVPPCCRSHEVPEAQVS